MLFTVRMGVLSEYFPHIFVYVAVAGSLLSVTKHQAYGQGKCGRFRRAISILSVSVSSGHANIHKKLEGPQLTAGVGRLSTKVDVVPNETTVKDLVIAYEAAHGTLNIHSSRIRVYPGMPKKNNPNNKLLDMGSLVEVGKDYHIRVRDPISSMYAWLAKWGLGQIGAEGTSRVCIGF